MTDRLNIADKQTLDEIKADTNILKNQNSGIKNVQSGVADFPGKVSMDLTISRVNTSKSFIIISKTTKTASSEATASSSYLARIMSPTTIRLERETSNTSIARVAWQVIEFN